MIPYLLAALGGYLIGESTKSKLLDNAANDSITDAGLEVASASVLAKGGTIFIAPNGKPSNLTPEQYKLVRTPEFKAWFGDWENDPENASKVVDENGEPLVVYHGTEQPFLSEKFKLKPQYIKHNQILFFAFEERLAKKYGKNVFEIFVSLKKEQEEGVLDDNGNWKLNKKKYDGFIVANFGAVKNINQIKLADGSNTTFDSNNTDIRYSGGGKINLYYRAETSNDFVKEKIFEPNGYYERVGKDGNPVIKYDEYVISDTPEIAASKTIYGAILGAASMMKFSQGIKKDNKIQIYLIDEKPDVDISHWQGADFEYLDEVRYRNSIVGKHLITYELTDDVYRLVKDFYEYKEWENNSKYDDQLEFDNRLEYIYQMIEDEKFYPTLKKLIDKSI